MPVVTCLSEGECLSHDVSKDGVLQMAVKGHLKTTYRFTSMYLITYYDSYYRS